MICAVTAVSSPKHVHKPSFDWSTFSQPIIALNIILIALCVGGLVYFVAGVNSMASGEYHLSAERAQIAQLTQAQSLLTVEKSATEDPVAATAYAQAQGMVTASNIVYVFENNNVALQQ